MLGTVVAAVALTACAASSTPAADSPNAPPAAVATPSAGGVTTSTTPPVRWIAVSVATLWVQPRIARPVDAPSLGNPAYPGTWVANMTVDQKRWLVGRLETQALYGTKVYVLGTSGAWTKVAVPSQPTPRNAWGYPGWLPTVQLTATAPVAASRVAVVRDRIAVLWRDAAGVGTSGGKVMYVSYDTRFPVVSATPTYVVVRMIGGAHRVLRRSDVVLHTSGTAWNPTRAKLITEARKFLGLPYLWAGTSGFAYDCSGYTYSLYHTYGVTLPRDADRQATRGRWVSWSSLLPGDLVFYESSGAIVHVAMYFGLHDGVRSIIEAPRTGATIRITALRSSGYAGARRFLSS